MRITPHFDSVEFACRDDTAYPSVWTGSRLKPLCEALEIIRKALGDRPITINSGFRSEQYNRKIGGAPASQHVQGRAADFTVYGLAPSKVHDAVQRLYDQGLLGIGGLGSYPSFTHIDVRPGKRLAHWGGSRLSN